MQLIAVNTAGKRVAAAHAEKKIDYHCPECQSPLRLRQGSHVQAHFYHYRQTTRCPHRNKSLAHLSNQLYLSEQLPHGEAILEHSFPAIRRIADVYWPAQRIVFEIQCSPMTRAEAEERERDYASLGMRLVWILHEARYNKRRLTAVEDFFVSRHTYFTSIRKVGSGVIYDQFDIIRNGRRCFKGAKFPLQPDQPYQLQGSPSSATYPRTLLQRWETRTLGFAGDLLDVANRKTNYDYSSLLALENRFAKKKRPFLKTFAAVYRAFLYALLEKFC